MHERRAKIFNTLGKKGYLNILNLCTWLINLELLWCVPRTERGNFDQLMFPCKCACFYCVLRSPETSEMGYITKQRVCIKSCLEIQKLPLTLTTCLIVRRLTAVNHWISPVFTRFYWIQSIKCAADFAIHISVYHSLVDEKFYSSGVLCCLIKWDNTLKFLTLKINVPSFFKTYTNQEEITNHETLISNIWVLRRGLRYLRYHSRTFNSFYIWHKKKLSFLPAQWKCTIWNFLKSTVSDKIRNWYKIENRMMQIGFHTLEYEWNFVFWLLLFCDLHSTKNLKPKTQNWIWVQHWALFSEWHNRDNNRHKSRTCQYAILQLRYNNSW